MLILTVFFNCIESKCVGLWKNATASSVINRCRFVNITFIKRVNNIVRQLHLNVVNVDNLHKNVVKFNVFQKYQNYAFYTFIITPVTTRHITFYKAPCSLPLLAIHVLVYFWDCVIVCPSKVKAKQFVSHDFCRPIEQPSTEMLAYALLKQAIVGV